MACVMVMGMTMTAFAAETTASTDTGTITISGVESGLTVNAYKIAEAKYDSSTGQFTGYAMLYTAGGFSIGSDGSYDEDALTEANLSALFTAAQARGVTYTATADADGVATFSNMPVGSYLFVVTGSEATIYGMVIGSVSYDIDEDTGEWAIVGGAVDVEGDNLWVKATTPTISKTETGGSLDDYEHGGSADLGDTLEYHITIGPIPTYEGSYPEFEVIDKISSDLTITDEELAALYIMDENGNILDSSLYTVERTDDGFTVDFVVNGVYTLNDYAGQTLIIDFCADVTSVGSADADDDDHDNYAELDYSTTSYVVGYDGEVDDTDHDYTFNALITKTDQDGEALEDAEFSLYTDEGCTVAYTQNGTTVTATSGEDGYFEFTGLEEGTYYMKETKAPAGYALNTNIYKIVISCTYAEDGTLTGYTITVYDSTNNDATVGSGVVTNSTASIMNTKTGLLPSTGGMGTMIFTLAGFAIALFAVVGVVVSRRRQRRDQDIR